MSLRHFVRRPPAVTAQEALSLIDAGALIIDVRREQDRRRNHIPGAWHIPLDQLEQRAVELPEDQLLITFCTGGLLSSGAANLLRELGFDAVNKSRGLIDWRVIGGSLISGTG
ncbi:rhodanese-like domain-containing protein [Kocuria rosea]|uniref:rhodanese-like domain-containing protein n=1 Tax=Kocuria rosea TaxID=1275 RepID=UPI00203DF41D|nr:rhodanese-like domain-containing protein [Kocuria rosea]MCM3689126.1 rhodanese-like domain-containing protein [Kocuria rosea]